MKKIIILPLFVIVALACSVGSLTPAETPTPEIPPTQTFTPLPTPTPVLPTRTFTPTPTLVGLKSPTPTLESSPTSTVVSVTPLAQITPNTFTPTVQMKGFLFVNTSLTEIFKAGECEPQIVRITAQVADITNTSFVSLFVRFKSLTAERASKWTRIYMETIGAGTYLHDLTTAEMKEDAYFQTSWIEYQIVASTQAGKEIGRTDIFKEKIKMLACVPTVTPTSASVKP